MGKFFAEEADEGVHVWVVWRGTQYWKDTEEYEEARILGVYASLRAAEAAHAPHPPKRPGAPRRQWEKQEDGSWLLDTKPRRWIERFWVEGDL